MRTDITQQEIQTISEWCKAAGVAPLDDKTLPTLVEYIDKFNLPLSFDALSAAANDPALKGKLSWRRLPTPSNWEDIVRTWLATECPKELLNQNGVLDFDTNAKTISSYIEEKGNVYSSAILNQAVAELTQQNRLAYYGRPAPKPEPVQPKKAAYRGNREEALALAGVHAQTGLPNHAHENDAPPAMSESAAQQATMKFLTRLAANGQEAFVKAATKRAAELRTQGKTWVDVFTAVQSDAKNFSAFQAIQNMIQNAPGRNSGEKITNSKALAAIAREGERNKMSLPNVARLIEMESDGMRRGRYA
jgi:hypothetical protein